MRRDPFARHRLALAPLCADVCGARPDLDAALTQVRAIGARAFLEFLDWHKLAPAWSALIARNAKLDVDCDFIAGLAAARTQATALYLAQAAALADVCRAFERCGVEYAVIKGAALREQVHADASLRPALDIDILARAPADAARVLRDAGFAAQQDVSSHEATFTRGVVAVDLHWDILRPGRTRGPVAQAFLNRRTRARDMWTLDDADTVVLMLIHPAFTKYVASPNASLVAVVDFVAFLGARAVDWAAVVARLEAAGLKTAAWTVLQWFAMVVPPASPSAPADVVAALAPARWRARYLREWIERDLPTRWLARPLPIQLGLTLALHDRASDAARAAFRRLDARRPARVDPSVDPSVDPRIDS